MVSVCILAEYGPKLDKVLKLYWILFRRGLIVLCKRVVVARLTVICWLVGLHLLLALIRVLSWICLLGSTNCYKF